MPWFGKIIIIVESRSYKENVHWLIESIKASKSLEQDKKAIIEIIKEVVPITYGCEVIFEVFPEPVFVEEERLNGWWIFNEIWYYWLDWGLDK